MEEEMLSAISHGEVNANVEVSDSSSVMRVTSKRPRHGGNGSSSRFKGVVPLQNGNWGAQIYTNQQRIWLGTFKSESEAAMSYDSAAIKLRNGDCHRNFSWNTITAQEPNFQSHYSTETVLNMIRDGSYRSKFMDFLRGCSEMPKVEVDLNPTRAYKNEGLLCRQLFQKELTPSDVGKLNRLVIPKKYALKYLPAISGEEDDAEDNISRVNDTELVFYDRRMKEWGFRYCYWASSQSYVFTRGWNRFVKEKNLKATDVIAFYVCQNQGGELRLREAETFFLIDVISAPVVDLSNQHADIEVDLQLHLGKDNGFGEDKDVNCAQIKHEDLVGENSRPAVGTRGFKLFGKLII